QITHSLSVGSKSLLAKVVCLLLQLTCPIGVLRHLVDRVCKVVCYSRLLGLPPPIALGLRQQAVESRTEFGREFGILLAQLRQLISEGLDDGLGGELSILRQLAQLADCHAKLIGKGTGH